MTENGKRTIVAAVAPPKMMMMACLSTKPAKLPPSIRIRATIVATPPSRPMLVAMSMTAFFRRAREGRRRVSAPALPSADVRAPA
jgi:hypothetical protein